MHLDILIDEKLLMCSATSPGIALAILAKQSAGFAFFINRKLLLCGVTSPRIALAILAKQSAGFAFFGGYAIMHGSVKWHFAERLYSLSGV